MIESCELVQVARIVDSRTTVRPYYPKLLRTSGLRCGVRHRIGRVPLGHTALVQRLGMLILFATSMYSIHTVY